MAATKLKIRRSEAVALFLALGLKTAKSWSLDKLTSKINEIESGPDEPLEDEKLDALLDEILNSKADIEVVAESDADDEEESEDDESEDDESEDDESEDDESEDDESEDEEDEDEEPKAKSKGKASKKSGGDKGKKGKPRTRETSIDVTTLNLLKAKPMTLDALVIKISKEFPERDAETLERTTKRRLTGYLQEKFGVKITKSDKGVYSVK